MHIANIMFSRGLGGIEQAFIDYAEALSRQNVKVTNFIYPKAQVKAGLENLNLDIIEINNLGNWDPLARFKIKKHLKKIRPDAIIAHGIRAVVLTQKAAKQINIPIIGVTHNYSVKRLIGLDAIFATTNDLKNQVTAHGQKPESVFIIPNMVRIKNPEPEIFIGYRAPPVIGTMGRMVKKKGFDIFINALAILNNESIEFKALIGGAGEEETSLKQQVAMFGLQDKITFPGWIKDKATFFNEIDIFCLPSIHEPFGIILLEAMAHGKPVITTNSEGPAEITTDGKDVFMVNKNDNVELANSLKKLIATPNLSYGLIKSAYHTAQNYSIDKIGQKMAEVVDKITSAKVI